jgi:protein-disulfide reductase (glutathione)
VTLARTLWLAATLIAVTAPAAGAHDWNDGAVAWKALDDGLALAKKDKKPVCLVVYTETCGHCANYSKVFHDPKVVEKAKRFVMIRLDQGADRERTQKYAPDGGYIPRTVFLGADGTIAPEIQAPRQDFKYFYDEKDPAGVLAGMDAALAKLSTAK